MNKDVIYIEPEDDITDIIAKIENSKEKIVALVPPKKAGVLRSIVNIKLIAKSGAGAGKSVVLVTTDPSIVRLAAATRLPVTKNLQSAPAIPEISKVEVEETTTTEEIIDGPEGDKADSEEAEMTDAEGESKDEETDEKDEEKSADGKKQKKDKKAKKEVKEASNPVARWFQKHKKLAIGGGIGIVVLTLVLVWAFVIAPAVSVTVGIRTTSNNFSENILFTEKMTDEKVSDGVFYLETKKLEEKNEVTFEATGSKNVGEKAKGEVIVYVFFPLTGDGGNVAVNAGTVFRIDDLAFVADKDVTLSWNGDIKALKEDCENYNNDTSLKNFGCRVSNKVPVTAENPGAKYNIAPSTTSWFTTASVNVYSETAMTGGTDAMITVIQQSDVDAALAKIKTSSETAHKEKLLESVGDGSFAIESTFNQTVGEPVVTPKVGEEVKEGVKPKLVVTTTDSIYTLDKTKIKTFITEKAKIADNYKIYNINDPFIENFMQTETGYIGKLKTSYVSGPKVTENEIVEIIKGKGLGVAQHDVKDIDGVSSIRIDTSYPWVMSIPSDPNKITVEIKVED